MSRHTQGPYKAGTDSEGRPYVDGPGDGTGYYHGTLWPEMRLSQGVDAEAAAKIANEAYSQGYSKAQRDIRLALGMKS